MYSYAYDFWNLMTSYNGPGTSNDTTYTYDAGGRRITKNVNGTKTAYFHDSLDVVAEYNGNDQLQRSYVTPGLDQNLSLTASGSTYYYLSDALGSIRQLIDANEATQNAYDYEAFGKVYGSPTENVSQPFRFTGRTWDAETEFYYFRMRSYAARTGAFVSRDPLLIRPVYAYVANSPILWADPLGLQMWVVGCGKTTSRVLYGLHLGSTDFGHVFRYVAMRGPNGEFLAIKQYDYGAVKSGWNENVLNEEHIKRFNESMKHWLRENAPDPCCITAWDIAKYLNAIGPGYDPVEWVPLTLEENRRMLELLDALVGRMKGKDKYSEVAWFGKQNCATVTRATDHEIGVLKYPEHYSGLIPGESTEVPGDPYWNYISPRGELDWARLKRAARLKDPKFKNAGDECLMSICP